MIVTICLLLSAGCGASPVAGGTPGVLLANGEPLSDVQVSVYQLDEDRWQPLGFGDTALDGTFQLVTTGASGPLWLAAGEYRCTLESVGAPVRIPGDFQRVETTPLRVSWSADDSTLNLEVPIRLIP